MRRKSARSVRSGDRLPSASGALTRLAYAHAEQAGIALDTILNASNITRRQIDNTRMPIAVVDQINFLNLVAAKLDDPLLGFHLAQGAELREVGLLYYILASSNLLVDALRRAARYSSIVNEGVVQRCVDRKGIGILFRYAGVSRHLDRHQIEFWMTATVRMCRQLTGLRMLPNHVRFAHHRSTSPELAEIFGDTIEFGSAVDEIVFSSSLRNAPIVSADPYLNRLLISYCEDAISHRVAKRSSFRSRVENAIAPLLPHGKATAEEVARQLGVSPRTFARRLSSEGRNFSGILAKLRSDLANAYLRDGDLSVSQVAWLLGYREIGSFSHAFKRWTGKSPREARNK